MYIYIAVNGNLGCSVVELQFEILRAMVENSERALIVWPKRDAQRVDSNEDVAGRVEVRWYKNTSQRVVVSALHWPKFSHRVPQCGDEIVRCRLGRRGGEKFAGQAKGGAINQLSGSRANVSLDSIPQRQQHDWKCEGDQCGVSRAVRAAFKVR